MPNAEATLDLLASTIQAGLTAAAAATTPALSPITVYAYPQPDRTMAYPCIVLNVWRDYVVQEGAVRGNKDGQPNLYSFVLLERLASEQQQPPDQVARQIVRRVDQLKAIFDHAAAQKLLDAQGNPGAVMAGHVIEVVHGQFGPYVQYRGRDYMGCYGAISVIENPTHTVYR